MTTRAIAYIRVSTDDQADHGVSLDAQRARVIAFAAQRGLELVDVVEGAGESAKSLERPALQRALAMLGADAEVLVIPTLDRLTRSLRDWGDLLETYFTDRAELQSAGETVDVQTASGRFVLNILFAKAQFEREQIGERTSAALQHKAKAGEYTGGGTPFGFHVVGERLEAHTAEQAVIAEARKQRAAGLSLRAISRALQELGHRSRTGAPFGAAQISRMLE